MYQLCQMVSQYFLSFVQLCPFPGIHLLDFFHRNESQETKTFSYIRIIHISPILVEVVGTGLSRIQPNRTAGGLSHLLSFLIGKQGDGHGMGILSQFLTNQLCSCQHIGPLVISAELHVTAVVLIETIEIVALHQHIRKLEEGKSLRKTVHIASGSQHFIYGKMRTYLSQKLHKVHISKPVRIVYHQCLPLGEVNETAHLLLKAGTVMVNHFGGHHLPHIGTTGRISDHTGSASNQGDRLIACCLQTLHQAQRHKVPYMKRIRSGVEANIKDCLSFIDHFSDFFFICNLGNQSSLL